MKTATQIITTHKAYSSLRTLLKTEAVLLNPEKRKSKTASSSFPINAIIIETMSMNRTTSSTLIGNRYLGIFKQFLGNELFLCILGIRREQ